MAIAVPNVWHNAGNPLDVNGDGVVTPSDVLAGVSFLNSETGDIGLPLAPLVPARDCDVNNDRACTPLDILLVINRLQAQARPVAKGEASGVQDVAFRDPELELSPLGEVIGDLAEDIAGAWG